MNVHILWILLLFSRGEMYSSACHNRGIVSVRQCGLTDECVIFRLGRAVEIGHGAARDVSLNPNLGGGLRVSVERGRPRAGLTE
ncbi:MAG: hypothetical protein JMM75_02535 [Candidatus Xiphinematobacter sp.]|nr:MAG: hypothetical protein JMM75_02535 [Candidatus Xiphinematobacter sp.]